MKAREFYNTVVLMRANERAFRELDKIPAEELTDEDRDLMGQHLDNWKYFEGKVDAEIERVNKLIKERGI